MTDQTQPTQADTEREHLLDVLEQAYKEAHDPRCVAEFDSCDGHRAGLVAVLEVLGQRVTSREHLGEFPDEWERETWQGRRMVQTPESRPGVVEVDSPTLGDMLERLGWKPSTRWKNKRAIEDELARDAAIARLRARGVGGQQ